MLSLSICMFPRNRLFLMPVSKQCPSLFWIYDFCLRNLLKQIKSTRHFQDLMVTSWEDDFLEIFYKISVSIPSFTRIFVECKHKSKRQKESEFIRRLSWKFRIPSMSSGTNIASWSQQGLPICPCNIAYLHPVQGSGSCRSQPRHLC